MGLLEALQKYIDAEEAKDPEIIDGTNIKDVLDVVDLSIAHSPVIPFRAPDHVSPAESLRSAVEAIETEGGGYILRDCPTMTHPVSADALKRMRARYLLTRGAVMRPRMDARGLRAGSIPAPSTGCPTAKKETDRENSSEEDNPPPLSPQR